MPQVQPIILQFRTFDDVIDTVAGAIAAFPGLKSAELALTELMLNAIEHGNLEISFEEKGEILENGAIVDELARRLEMPRYRDRTARLEILDFPDEIVVLIADDGDGFDWKAFLDRNVADVTGMHGRGMLMSEQLLKTMTYIGRGNKVVAVVAKDDATD